MFKANDTNPEESIREFKRIKTLSSLSRRSRGKSRDSLNFDDRRAARDYEKSTEYSLRRKDMKYYNKDLAQLSQRVRRKIQKEKINILEKQRAKKRHPKTTTIEFHNSQHSTRRTSLRSLRSAISHRSKTSRKSNQTSLTPKTARTPRMTHQRGKRNKFNKVAQKVTSKLRSLSSRERSRKSKPFRQGSKTHRVRHNRPNNVGKFHPALSQQLEKKRRIKRSLRNSRRAHEDESRLSPISQTQTPKTQKTVRKKIVKSQGIPQKKIEKIIGKKENGMLSNYEFLGPEDKVEVQNKIIEILKRKLIQEQKLRLEKESELEAILNKDNLTVFDLEEQIIRNDTELGVMFSERKGPRERVKFGSAEKYQRRLFETSVRKFNETSSKKAGAQTDRPHYSHKKAKREKNVKKRKGKPKPRNHTHMNIKNMGKLNSRPRKTHLKLKSRNKPEVKGDDFLKGFEYSTGGYLESLKKNKMPAVDSRGSEAKRSSNNHISSNNARRILYK